MSVSWASRSVLPACGHRRCAAARIILIAAGPCLYLSLPFLIAVPSWQAAVVFGGSAAVCGLAIAVTCRSRDMEALIEATREAPEHVPDAWVKEFRQ